MTVEEIICQVIKNEGGFVSDPSDRGGETKYGITKATAAKLGGYTGPMVEMPIQYAIDIYKANYWKFDAVLPLSSDLAYKLMDFGVNAGPGTAIEVLQAALSALSGQLVVADSVLGPKTLNVLQTVLKSRRNAEFILLNTVKSGMAQFYVKIVERDESQQKFLFGWLGRCFS